LSSLPFRSFFVGLVASFVAACVLFVPAIAQAQASGVSGAAARLGDGTLKRGDRGSRVKALQQLLTRAGFRTSTDGTFGSGTARVVRRFQRSAKLAVTGIADAATLTALRGATAGAASGNANGGAAAGTTDSAGTSTDARHLGDRVPLRRGMTGHDVRILQDYLTRAGFQTGVDGQYGSGTIKSVRLFEAAQQRTQDDDVDAGDIDALRSLVDGQPRSAAPAGQSTTQPGQSVPVQYSPGDLATIGADGLAVAPANAPDQVKQIIAAGNVIAKKPYHYGGGHGKWEDTGYDCSGSVSYALHGAGLLDQALSSGDFMSWGEKGPGQWVTLYANGGHMYMVIAGVRFDTSGRTEDGSRWHADMRSTSGYTVVHPPGL
jgi:peptidoglycan hydrolase-like protein with peptidoglycan-binding domain